MCSVQCIQEPAPAPALLLLMLLLSANIDARPDTYDAYDNANQTLIISGAWVGASRGIGDALAALLAQTLRAAGVDALVKPPPRECSDQVDSSACLNATLAALAAGTLHAALLPVPAAHAPPAWLLRDAGLEDLGDAVPPAHRSCLLTPSPLHTDLEPRVRSLLDLVDPQLAVRYNISSNALRLASDLVEPLSLEWCNGAEANCATLLAGDIGDAQQLAFEAQRLRLRARVVSTGAMLPDVVAAASATNPVLVCDWTPSLSSLGDMSSLELGPPPCPPTGDCVFDARRLVKYASSWELTRVQRARRSLVRFTLSGERLLELAKRANVVGAEAAAREAFDAHPLSERPREVRVGVLVPLSGTREVFDPRELVAAATLAEEQLEAEKVPRVARFKVEVYDDSCSPSKAYKYLLDALLTGEYGSLSAMAGPACGAGWVDVVKQSVAHAMPTVAYTPQAGATATESEAQLALLAAGEVRDAGHALAAFMNRMEWKRLAAISEPPSRALLQTLRRTKDIIVHLELSDDINYKLIEEWMSQAAAAHARVLAVLVEDAQVVRGVLCAAYRAGLTARAGAVLLLPAPLDVRALHPPLAPGEHAAANCTHQQLLRVADGHFAVQAEWAYEWERGGADDGDARDWSAAWRTHCRRLWGTSTGDVCEHAPSARSALLYDVLRLWAKTLDRALISPSAFDDLHAQNLTRQLVEQATTLNFTGLTGRFRWSYGGEGGEEGGGGARARVAPLVVTQWHARYNSRDQVARWSGHVLHVNETNIRWSTESGAIPDDGTETCALQWLAHALHTECRTAHVALAAFLLALAAAALAAAALYCKRRLDANYTRRLQMELGLCAFASKNNGLDKWEIPRDRVVINRKLGKGAFGTVYGGHAFLGQDRGWTAVAVKTLKEDATTDEKVDFLSEAEAMKRFDHKNVVKLLGVVMKTEPVCTVMEFMLYADLKNYLLARRHLVGGCEEDAGEEVSPRQLTAMALDVARALSYLAQMRYVHRDVAARNCLVGASRVVKLADFGMTRVVFDKDYYRFSRKGMLPVRWMAPESLAHGVFSTASDIWSFGVLLYEIVTFGSLPYQGMSNDEVLTYVKAGRRLDLPSGLKPRLEGLIKSCWQHEYKTRPRAAEVVAFLADSPRLLAPCLGAGAGVPLDALPLPASARTLSATSLWGLARDSSPTQMRWGRTMRGERGGPAPASGGTDTTYLSADGDAGDALSQTEADAFLS